MANQHVNKVAVNGKTVLDLSSDTVYPGMLAKGITAHDKSGAQITGTLEVPATEERTVELSMASGNQVILPTSGKVMHKVTVQKPATLLPENIKKNVVIGGVTGTLAAGSGSVQPSKSISITQNGTTTVTPDTGYDALGKVEVSVNVASSMTATNIITFEYTPTAKTLDISHDVLVGAGIDTEDKFFKIIGISIFPKNGDVDWFCVSYGGALNKTSFMQHLPHNHSMPNSGALSFYNLSGALPYRIALQTTGIADNAAVNKTFVVTLLLSE